MKRAILLGTGAFPFLITYWMKTLKLWDSVVDKIYISVDSYNVPEAKEFIIAKAKENQKIVLLDNLPARYGWPYSYNYGYEHSNEDLFLILHDDTFIFDSQIVDNYFKLAEKDIVVTPLHEIYSPKDIIEKALDKKYPGIMPLRVTEDKGDVGGSRGYSFLLYLLFISRTNLEKTSKNFSLFSSPKGKYCSLLDITPDTDLGGDTGFGLGLELFEKGVKIKAIPRYGTGILTFQQDALETLKEWERKRIEIFEEGAGWLHLQNTGNTIPHWYLKPDLMITKDGPGFTSALQKIRLAWFLEMLECDDYTTIPEVKNRGYTIFNLVKDVCHADIDEIREIKNIFHRRIWG